MSNEHTVCCDGCGQPFPLPLGPPAQAEREQRRAVSAHERTCPAAKMRRIERKRSAQARDDAERAERRAFAVGFSEPLHAGHAREMG